MCRAFPLQFRASASGVVVGMRLGECLQADKVSGGELVGAREEEVRAGQQPLPPADAATLLRLRQWSAAAHEQPSPLPLARPPPAQGFEDEALGLEERICRLALIGKDALQHSDIASGIAMLAVECWLARFRALDLAGAEGRARATGADLNQAWKLETQLLVRGHLSAERLSSRALASAITALDAL